MLKFSTIVIACVFALTACAVFEEGGVDIGIEVPPCTLHTGQPLVEFCAEVEADPDRRSVFCDIGKKGMDPCMVYRSVEFAVKEGTILEGYTEEEFNEWADEILELAKAGLTADDLKNLLMAQAAKINKLAGYHLMIITDTFVHFSAEELLSSDDVLLVEAMVIDLKKEVHKYSLFVS